MDIKIGNNIDYISEIKSVLQGGHIAILYREIDIRFGDKIASELVAEYRVTKKVLPTNVESNMDVVDDMMELDEDVRLIVSIGNGALSAIAEKTTTMLGIPLVAVVSSPHILDEHNIYLIDDNELASYKVVPPNKVIIPMDYLELRGGFDTVIANIADNIVGAVDKFYIGVMQGKCSDMVQDVNDILDKVSRIDKIDIFELIKLGYDIGNSENFVRRIAHILGHNSKENISTANYEFCIAYTILMLYKTYLLCDGIDLIYPPEEEKSAKVIESISGKEIEKSIHEYKMVTSSEYMRAKHMEKEYKEELLAVVERALTLMSMLSKKYRRLSRDAGYNMYAGVSLDSILCAISAYAICEDRCTPLRMMKAGGYLERYLDRQIKNAS